MRPGFSRTIGTGPGEAAGAAAAFAEFAETHGVPAAVRRSVSVALDELLSNTLTHGFPDRAAGEVVLEAELRPDRLRVTLSDAGIPFNPLAAAAPDTGLSLEERDIGGLGIHLTRRLMDDVAYERRADRNVVTLTKLLSERKAMEITTRVQNGVTLVALAGSLDSNTSPEAQRAIDGLLAGGVRKVVVDCTALDYVSSAGLRVLLGAAKRLTGGGALRLFGLNESVREVFDISGFSKILSVYGAEGDALRGL